MRSLSLLSLELKTFLNQAVHDLLSELVVLICSLVLAATFFYVFNDFINVQVESVSGSMRDRFAQVAAIIIIIVATGFAARSSRQLLAGNTGFRNFALGFGETWQTIRGYLLLRILLTNLVWLGPSVWLIHNWFVSLFEATNPTTVTSVLILYVFCFSLPAGSKVPEDIKSGHYNLGRWQALFLWRLRSILRKASSWLFVLVSAGFALLGLFIASGGAPYFATSMCFYMAGLLIVSPMVFHLRHDLEACWLERSLGVSHDEFVNSYQILGIAAGLALAIPAGLITLTIAPWPAVETLKTALAAIVPALIFSQLMFQIDGRRPLVIMMTLVIVSLFMVTAVLAHILSIVLLLILKYYADRTQHGRFYRA